MSKPEFRIVRHPSTARHPGRRTRSALLAGAFSAGALLAAPPPSPLEGIWLGTIGTPRERIETGFELKRDDAGELRLFLTQPVANYFAVPWPGEVRVEGDRIVVDGLSLSLTLVGDRLEGTFPGPNSQASFTRASALPKETPPPAVPELPARRWRTNLGGQISASPAVADGIAYVGTTAGVFNAVNTKDGNFLWTFPAGRPIFGTALVDGDALYFVCDDGHLFKLNRADGKELWRYELGDERVARLLPHPRAGDWDWQGPAPVAADGVVFVGSGDGSFHAVDAATGQRRWRFATGGKIRNDAAIDGPRVVVGSTDKSVYALDRASGALVWKHETDAAIDTAPVAYDGKILIGNRGGGLYALDAKSGEQIWKTYFWGSWVESTPVVVDGTIYIGASDLRRVSAISPVDGKVLWRSDVYGWSWGTPLVVGDKIYAGTAGGSPYFFHHVAGIVELDRKSGRILRRTPLPEVDGAHQWGIGGSLVRSGDTIVATTVQGGLVGYPLP